MSRQDPQMKLRLPEALKEKITRAAEKNGRSMNAEIINRLEQSIDFEDDYGTLEEILKEIWKDIDVLKSKVAEHDESLFPKRYQEEER